MQNPSQVCGNCGKPVADSDVTCPHCDVLLAAYASPAGSTSPHAYESSEPIADAVPEAEMYVPEPAPPVTIPDQVEVVSTAPRPLFDTKLTVEEISKAAEGEHEESLVVVSEEKVVTKPTVFETPDWAKPPSDAKPVELVDGGDEEMIARSAEEPPRSQPAHAKTIEPAAKPPSSPPAQPRSTKREPAGPDDDSESDRRDVTAPAPEARPTYAVPPKRQAATSPEPEKTGESWLYDPSQSGPAATPTQPKPKKERKDRPQPVRTTTQAPGKRGTTESYLQKLHAEAGYVSDEEQLSKPVETGSSSSVSHAVEMMFKGKPSFAGAFYLLLGFVLVAFFLASFVDIDIGFSEFLMILAAGAILAAKNWMKVKKILVIK